MKAINCQAWAAAYNSEYTMELIKLSVSMAISPQKIGNTH